MMKLAWCGAAALLGAALTIGGLGTAPKAFAGCQPGLLPGESYCDKPVAPDGTWERCHQGASYPVYGGKGVIEDITPPPECYPVDPTQPVPLGQPSNHIDD
ncbi:CDGP domain-containing protein [Mycobacterium simiae]|nr:hypothetical protein [Mycobacterium simiae]